MDILTIENVDQAFQQIIETHGHLHKYKKQNRTNGVVGCYYTLPEKVEGKYVPSCIIGQIIDVISPEDLQTFGEQEELRGNSCGAASILDGSWISWSDEDGNVTPEAHSFVDPDTEEGSILITALEKAQGVQDIGETWGEAYRAFRLVIEGSAE